MSQNKAELCAYVDSDVYDLTRTDLLEMHCMTLVF